MTVIQCRSYPALTFDGCPACVDAALDAIGQAGLYVLGRTAPDLAGQTQGPLKMNYLLRVQLFDESGEKIGSDEIGAEQTIEAIRLSDESAGDAGDAADAADADDATVRSSMRLEDFQTVLDRVELSPSGPHGLCGSIAGHLYAFERSIGAFEIEVVPNR
jgi:hypothetical protein